MLDIECIPVTECLKDTVERALPFWFDFVVPAIKVCLSKLLSLLNESMKSKWLLSILSSYKHHLVVWLESMQTIIVWLLSVHAMIRL